VSGETEIRPEPTGEEAAAIAAALRVLRQALPPVLAQVRSGWQRAARREALRTELPHEAGGWWSDR
jgi:hypothetical protein